MSKDVWEGNFDRFIFEHSIVEASTAVKGQFFRFLMKKYEYEDKFVYLDQGCFVYSDFRELYSKYSVIHDSYNADNVSTTPWSYNYYSSGEKISDVLRIKYRGNYEIMFDIE